MLETEFYFRVGDVKKDASRAERQLQDQVALKQEEIRTLTRNGSDLDPSIFEIISSTHDVRLGIFLLSSAGLNAIRSMLTRKKRAEESTHMSKQHTILNRRIHENENLAAEILAHTGDAEQSLRMLSFEGKRVVVDDSIPKKGDYSRNVKMISRDVVSKN